MGLAQALLLLPAAHLAAAETVLGAYVFHRHGDRTTKAYTPVSLTALGADQVFASGTWYRDNYIVANSSRQIHGMATDIAVLSQMSITSPIDNTLQNSAQVFLQGLYPPAGSVSAQTLANGSSVEAPFGGYQYIPVNAVTNAASSGNAEDNSWLQGGSGCTNAIVSSNNYFFSSEYLATLASTKDFYQSLLPVINTTFPSPNATFKNAYTIYDYVHVSAIHNTTIPSDSLLTNETLVQLQTRADQHEWGLAYNSSDTVRAIAGSVLAGQIIQALNTTLYSPVAKASAQKLTIQFGAYATFMSFFGLAQAPAASPNFYGIVDYASSIMFELVTNTSLSSFTAGSKATIDPADVSVRFLFANGSASDSNPLQPFALFGQSEVTVPWATFLSEMSKFAIDTTAAWCTACGSTTGSCASTSTSSGNTTTTTSESSTGGSGGVSRPVAGVIGALVTLVVILGLEALVMAIGGLRLAKKSSLSSKGSNGSPVAMERA